MSSVVPMYGFGGGSGGGGLNFSVVGGLTQPADPKENTIWVETNVDITGWIFSATEPEAPADGKDGPVWITTGTSSTVEFNALKKNGIQVYPLSAKQFVSGAWQAIPFSIYKNGGWVEAPSELVLFDGENGGDNTAATGGLAAFAGCTIGLDKITLSENNNGAGFTTNNNLDLSPYTTLVVYGEVTANSNINFGIHYGITTSKIAGGVWTNENSKFSHAVIPPSSTEPVLIPISEPSGYVAGCGYGNSTITKIVLR